MDRHLAIVGAPSSIGIRPYDDGVMRYVNRAPEVFRERGIVQRLRATDLGDVVPPPYRDFVRTAGRVRNETQVAAYSRLLAERVAMAAAHRQFVLVLGGDCSVVLGCLLGAKRAARGPIGLAYFDAHTDFATADESLTGSAAGMSLRFASGRGDAPLARIGGIGSLVDDHHIALIGRRDGGETARGHAALAASAILDLPDTELLTRAPADIAADVVARVADDVRGFWIQVDVDVLNPTSMSAVDSPEPGGPMPHELLAILEPLVAHPLALGLSLTIYDPALDPDRAGARQIVKLLESLLR